MKFSPTFFRQRIEDVLTAVASLRRDTPGSRRQASAPRLQLRCTELGRNETCGQTGLVELTRKVASLSHRLDLFAVESTRRQDRNESLTRAGIARTDLLFQQLRAEDNDFRGFGPIRGLTPATNPETRSILIAEIDGHRVGVPGGNLRLAWHYLLRGGLEPGLERFMRRTLKPGMSFVDAGAGVGVYTVLAAVLMGEHGSVISLEPDPKAYSILVWNLESNLLTPERGVRHGVMTIASLEDVAISTDSDRPCADVVRIGAEQVSLESLCSLDRISRRCPRIQVIMEYCASLAGTTVSPLQLLDQIVSHGFSAEKVDAESGECSPLNREEFASAFSTNLVLRRVG